MTEAALHTLLAGGEALAALVSTRIYLEQAPQDVSFPFLVMSPAGGEHMQSMDGSSGVETLIVTLTATAATYTASKAVLEAARLAIQGYAGTVESTVFQSILADGGTTSRYNPPVDSSEIGTFSLSQDYVCSAVEAKPSFA